ncbi:MAG: hypothetical protein WCT04_08080 [Planctomycetota bacterium]
MTAANPNDVQDTHRRLSRLLIFLILFWLVVVFIAMASRMHWFGGIGSNTFFDPKGIMTGPGTFIVLIGAALSALIVFVVYKKWTLKRAEENPATQSAAHVSARRELALWLVSDVFKLTPTQSVDAPIAGFFRGRRFAVERIDDNGSSRLRFAVDTASPLAMRVWWLGKTRSDSNDSQAPSEFETTNSDFENCCGWQAPAPRSALDFLNRDDVTGTLHRICFISGRNDGADDIGVSFENGRIVLTTRMPPHDFMYAAFVLVSMQELSFLADTLESKVARPFLAGNGIVGSTPFGDSHSFAPPKSRSAFMDFLSCLMFVFLVLVPLAAIWIAGSYYCAKALDMSAGMLCFFVPVLLLAIFVFTRPTVPPPGNAELAGGDMETVRAAALKFWEQTLRADPGFAALLDAYEQRL